MKNNQQSLCWRVLVGMLALSLVTGATAEVPAEGTATEPVATAEAEDKIVIEYIEADIQNVLRSLAARAGVNLILGDEVQGKVTVRLEDVTFLEAMRLIVESKGYAFVQDKNIIKIKSKELLEAEPVELRLMTLNYAKAEDLLATVQAVMSPRGKAQVDPRSNTLILADTPSSLAKILPLIQQLDTQTPQVMIEAKFVETTRNPKKDLGINWTDTLLNHNLSATANNIDPNTGDVVPGFSLVKNLAGGAWTPATALLNAGQARVVFSFINRDSETELLANPRIVTTDNGKARISIATQFPIPNFTFSEQTASLQIAGFEYKDIGIILNVTPRINKDDFITLEVQPEASSSTENATLQSGGGSAVEIPIINTRTAATTVLIKSGHTLAIGGLMRTDVDDRYTKVPVLGDVPGLGALFRSKTLNKSKRDLLIFLTPTIIAPNAPTGYEAHYDRLPQQELYTNDSWMPEDNAKPRRWFRAEPVRQGKTPTTERVPVGQNFGPKNPGP